MSRRLPATSLATMTRCFELPRCLEGLMEETDGEDNLSVQFIDEKRGFGILAFRKIGEGEQIFVEAPLLSSKDSMQHTDAEGSIPGGTEESSVRGKEWLASYLCKALSVPNRGVERVHVLRCQVVNATR